jgi:RNA polymerase sigma factor (TIGR02999 family)
MQDVTHILSQIESGDPLAANKLLPLVYDELRKLAKSRMANERSDHTLQSTALVHEAYVRLVDVEKVQHWDSRGHFFAAAAEAMRRILIESAVRKRSQKRGGDLERIELADDLAATCNEQGAELIDFNELLDQLALEDAVAAQLVKLRLFAGLSVEEAGQAMGMSRTVAYENWKFARAWFTCSANSLGR